MPSRIKLLYEKESADKLMRYSAKYPILSPEKELALGRKVQAMLPLLKETGLTPDEKQAVRIGLKARDRLVFSNLKWAMTHVLKKQDMGLDLDDLLQEAMIALVKAADRYNPDKGYKFSTYSYWWLRQQLNRAIQDKGRMVRLPIHVHDDLYKLREISRVFSQTESRRPSLNDLVELSGFSEEKVEKLLRASIRTKSLNDRVKDDSQDEMLDFIRCEDRGLTRPENKEYLLHLFAKAELNDRQRLAISLRYGIGCDRPLNLREIGDLLGCNKEWVRQMNRQSLRKMTKIAQREQVAV